MPKRARGLAIHTQDTSGAMRLEFAAQDNNVLIELVVIGRERRLFGFDNPYREPVASQPARKAVIMRR